MASCVTMFANPYPFAAALKLFGAIPRCGAQLPEGTTAE